MHLSLSFFEALLIPVEYALTIDALLDSSAVA